MNNLKATIRSLTPVGLRRFIQRTGDFFGAGLSPDFPSIECSLQVLKRQGFSPGYCVDVGAYTGEWTEMFKSIFPDSDVLMLEAQESKRSMLNRIATRYPESVRVEIGLVGPEDGREVEFVEMETGSSVFEESSNCARTKVTKTTRRLDSILEQTGAPWPDMIKLDVQGYELQVLAGAQTALTRASVILMEVSLIPINTGSPRIAEVVGYMDSKGFHVFDFCSQIRRNDGALWQTDLLFVKSDSPLVPKPVAC